MMRAILAAAMVAGCLGGGSGAGADGGADPECVGQLSHEDYWWCVDEANGVHPEGCGPSRDVTAGYLAALPACDGPSRHDFCDDAQNVWCSCASGSWRCTTTDCVYWECVGPEQ